MAKLSVRYICSDCGTSAPKWMGRCAGCGRWNTLEEEVQAGSGKASARGGVGQRSGKVARPIKLKDIESDHSPRISTRSDELDRVLGGGMVNGSLILLGGEPGIGKSTLILQVATRLAENNRSVLYVSGEESAEQIGIRARRLGAIPDNLDVLSENRFEALETAVREIKPGFLIVDSIQTIFTDDLPATAGSVSQVRECAARLMSMAKSGGCPVLLIGHVTKEGGLAGPRVLEHLVDTVLTFEGDRHHALRILRAVKNRFGSTEELGLFEMTSRGLAEVNSPAQLLLDEGRRSQPGTCALACVEGTRPLIAEVQALVTPTHYGQPQRSTTGVDPYRVNMLNAVLEKRCGIHMYNQDTFVSIAGGLSLREPAVDLAVACAILSSHRNQAVPTDWVVFGEIGLGGELRPVGQASTRLKEAVRLGFKHALLPAGSATEQVEGITVHKAANLGEAFEAMFGNVDRGER